MDTRGNALSLVLNQLRVRGAVYFAKRLPETWGVEITESQRLCRFHFVLSGSAWIEIPGTGRVEELKKNDFAIVPHGRKHFLRDKPDSCISMQEVIPGPLPAATKAITLGENETGLMCGYFRYAESTPRILTDHLPDMLILRNGENAGSDATVCTLAGLTLSETRADNPASELILNRCAEILFLMALRDWLADEILPGGVLTAFSDQRIKRAITAMLMQPAEAWTVEGLAKLAGQSRTAFANIFKSELGVGPIEYLHMHRIELARNYLIETDLRLDAIAAQVGYQDTSAFGRAFSRSTGMSPAQFRKTTRE